MKFWGEVEGKEYAFELRREGERLRAAVNGRAYELIVLNPGCGHYLLIAEGKVYECFVDAKSQDCEVHVNGAFYAVSVLDPSKRGVLGRQKQHAGRALVKSPMPGRLVGVMVAQGDEVNADQPLVVIEAMKMQNELKSPRAGKVSEVPVHAGNAVAAGDILVIIE